MKKLIGCLLLSVCSTTVFADPATDAKDHAKFPLVFTKEIQGSCGAENLPLVAEMGYSYDFNRSHGVAFLKNLNHQKVPVVLYPLGLQETSAFMSDLPAPVPFNAPKEPYSFNMIFMRVDPDGTKSAMLRLHNEAHDCIVATENFIP